MTVNEIITSIRYGEYIPYKSETVDNAIIKALEKQISKKPILQDEVCL